MRREVSTLEQSVQSAQSAATAAKFKEQNLQQEVESLRRTNEWLDNELKTKQAEHTKFRREKSSRIAELQQQNEDAAGTVESLQRNEQHLRTRISELSDSVEERLSEIQSLREEATNKEDHLRKELDTANRLNSLLSDSLGTERNRNKDLSDQVDEAKENAAGEIGRLGAEIETEHQEREAAESRVAVLEGSVERLRSDLALLKESDNRPATPTPRFGRSLNGPTARASPGGSRFASPAPASLKGSMSYTQMVSDYHSARSELDAERRRNRELQTAMDDMMGDLEAHRPLIEELREEHARLEAHIVQMSKDLESAGKERDNAKDDAERQEGEVGTLAKEDDLLRKQLRDLSAQVRVLLLEVNTQRQGAEGLSQEERLRFEALARGQDAYHDTEGASETDKIISQQLTTFRNIEDLQAQNEKLMRGIRELSDQVKAQKQEQEGAKAADAAREAADLRRQLEQAQEKINSTTTMSNSYIQERDMFRRMVLNKSQMRRSSQSDLDFGESMNSHRAPVTPARNGVVQSIEGSPSANEIANYSKLLKELQSHFDSYKTEAANDRALLKEENRDYSQKNAELRTELSKKTGEAALAVDRYGMLEGNYALLKNENAELQKRSQRLSDQSAKQEIRAQQVTEDLVEAKGLLESMRNETANLKAEKDWWRSVEKRLTEDNNMLVSERDRLNALNANLQTVLNDREHNDSDTRRRLQTQIESLEADLQADRRKLNEEAEESKRLAMRREYESQQSQSRIDDLVTRLGSVREELVEAKTSRDHLQSKADELTIELRSAEERVQLLQPRQTGSDAANTSENGTAGPAAAEKHEQALALEVSELKRDLDLSRTELSNAKTEVEQYKAISHDAEAELSSINETQEQFRQEMDETLEERSERIATLEKKIEELQTEISTLNSELGEKLRQEASFTKSLDDQRSGFENEIATLRADNERTATAAHFHQEDLKAQAQIAQQAQKNYEDELVKHAEAAKALSAVRSDYQSLKVEAIELRGASEAAQARLTQNEESWNEAKERYENELREVDSRKNDLLTQNKVLHQQLETLSHQLGELRKSQATQATGDYTATVPVAGEENWQELIKYVRREKEIVEVQFELSSQEAKRLRQQLDHTQAQLEETRLKLAQQRRAEENSERSALNHKKLLDTINELNLNRESNATLRLEKNEFQQSLKDRERVVEELRARLQPLHAKLQELEDLKESQDEELRMTREARERFEQRYLDVLHKSNAVDPAEHDTLKEKLTELEAERTELTAKRDELQQQVDTFSGQIEEKLNEANDRFQETKGKLIEQSKNKAREQNAKIREKDAALQAANAEKQEVETHLKAAQEEAEKANAEKQQAQSALADLQSKAAETDVQMGENQPINDPAGPSVEEHQSLKDQLQDAINKAESARAQVETLQDKVTSAESKVAQLESQLVCQSPYLFARSADWVQASKQQEVALAEERTKDLESQLQTASEARPNTPVAQSNVELVKVIEDETATQLRESLSKLEKEADDLKAQLLVLERAEQVQIEGRSVVEVISEHADGIRAELTARHDERMRQVEKRFEERFQAIKETLSKRLASAKAEVRAAGERSKTEALQNLQQQHAAEIEALNTRHAEELQELRNVTSQERPAVESIPGTEATTATPEEKAEMTEAEVKEMLSRNAAARKIVSDNIRKHIQKTTAEQEKITADKLAQAETKAKLDREQAVSMEGKKMQLKVTMAEGRYRGEQAKTNIVQQAANETPEKPVGEVWAVAKDAKAPKPTLPSTTISAASPTSEQNAKSNPFAATKAAQDAAASPPATTAAKDQSAPSPKPTQPGQPPSATSANGPSTAGKPGLSGSAFAPQGQASSNSTANAPTAPAGRAPSGSGPARGASSGLPIPASARGRGQASFGMRGPLSNAGRGRGGRGGVPGRGGSQAGGGSGAAPTGPAAQAGAEGGGGSGNMNAQAQTFVPAKRAREDSGLEGSVHAGGGENKRQRGGGQFSG